MGWNSTLTRKTPMKRTGFKTKPFFQRTKHPRNFKQGSLKPGKKTRAWDAVRAKLKVAFADAGITSCELGLAGCWRDNALGFAHSLKRRNIPRNSPLLEECILACNTCHDKIELLQEVAMAEVVRGTIKARRVAVARV
jgi:hypothetical protein